MTTTPRQRAPTDPSQLTRELRTTLHDLNNALTTVLANAQLAATVLGPESDVSEEMDDVVEGARAASDLTRRLRELARDLDETVGDAP